MKILDKLHIKRIRKEARADGMDYSRYTDAEILEVRETVKALKKNGKTDSEIITLFTNIKSSLEDGQKVLDDIKQNPGG